MTSHSNGAVPPPAGGTPGVPGPLSRAVAEATAERARERTRADRRTGWEHTSGGRPRMAPKRLLVAVSHAIEKAVVSSPVETPTVVIALFQRLDFFERERVVYEHLAESGAEVVVGFVRGEDHEPPRGVHTVLIDPAEKLADEWTVVAVGPRTGAFLVATDQHAFDAGERSSEAGRQFAGRWGYAHGQAASELARLRASLGTRLPETLVRSIDALLADVMASGGEVAGSGGTPGETWATASLQHMITRMQTAQAGSRALREQLADAHRAAEAQRVATADPSSGLPTPDFLDRWSAPDGSTELPVGLGLFDIAGLADVGDDPRAEYHAARKVAAALSQPLGPVDAVVRLSAREFLVVVPGASARHLAGLCDEVAEQLELTSDGYPHVRLTATVATVVTHTRPLPLDDLRAALTRMSPDGAVDAGHTSAGERVAVTSSRLGPADPETPPTGMRVAHDEHSWFAPEPDEAPDPEPSDAGPLAAVPSVAPPEDPSPDALLPGSRGAPADVPQPRRDHVTAPTHRLDLRSSTNGWGAPPS